MPTVPYLLFVEGVAGAGVADPNADPLPGPGGVGTAKDLIALPTGAQQSTPRVLLESVSLTTSASGSGATMTFTITQPDATSGPFTDNMADNAVIRFYDTRYNATIPVALGYVAYVQMRQKALGIEVQVSGGDPANWLEKLVVRRGKIGTAGGQNVGTINLTSAANTDIKSLNEILYYVDARSDVSTRRLINTSSISGSGITAVRHRNPGGYAGVNIKSEVDKIPVGSLKGVLDTIAEAAGGADTYVRRYWVDAEGRINYSTRQSPTYPTAPFEIVTTASQANPTGTSGTTTSKILASDLRVQYDHEQIVKSVFTRCGDFRASLDSSASQPYVRTFDSASPNGPGLTTRLGARPQALFDLPQVKGLNNASRDNFVSKFGGSMLTIRSQPLRSVRVTVMGANLSQTSSPDHQFGYTQGYAQTGASAYTLIKTVAPDQWIKINAPALGLSAATIRIEAVTWSFAKGSTEAMLELECDWRRPSLAERIG